jgi:hypothetical protein
LNKVESIYLRQELHLLISEQWCHIQPYMGSYVATLYFIVLLVEILNRSVEVEPWDLTRVGHFWITADCSSTANL